MSYKVKYHICHWKYKNVAICPAWQPGTILNRLNARQTENFTEFDMKASFKLLACIECFFRNVKRL